MVAVHCQQWRRVQPRGIRLAMFRNILTETRLSDWDSYSFQPDKTRTVRPSLLIAVLWSIDLNSVKRLGFWRLASLRNLVHSVGDTFLMSFPVWLVCGKKLPCKQTVLIYWTYFIGTPVHAWSTLLGLELLNLLLCLLGSFLSHPN